MAKIKFVGSKAFLKIKHNKEIASDCEFPYPEKSQQAQDFLVNYCGIEKSRAGQLLNTITTCGDAAPLFGSKVVKHGTSIGGYATAFVYHESTDWCVVGIGEHTGNTTSKYSLNHYGQQDGTYKYGGTVTL